MEARVGTFGLITYHKCLHFLIDEMSKFKTRAMHPSLAIAYGRQLDTDTHYFMF